MRRTSRPQSQRITHDGFSGTTGLLIEFVGPGVVDDIGLFSFALQRQIRGSVHADAHGLAVQRQPVGAIAVALPAGRKSYEGRGIAHVCSVRGAGKTATVSPNTIAVSEVRYPLP